MAGVNVGNYDAKDCTIMVNSVYITGLGETMVKFEKDEAFSSAQVGAQGDVIRSTINNPLYKLTLSVQITSPQFSMLKGLKNQKEAFPVWVINNKLKIKFGGTKADLAEMPNLEFASEAGEVEFVFNVYDGDVL